MTKTAMPAPTGDPIRKISAAFFVSFLFIVLVAVVVGVTSVKIRNVSQRIIANDLAKMMLIDQVSRNVSVLHLHVSQS